MIENQSDNIDNKENGVSEQDNACIKMNSSTMNLLIQSVIMVICI